MHDDAHVKRSMRGRPMTFSSGATVEYDRNFLPNRQHDYLEKKLVNVESVEGESEKFCKF